MFTGDAGIQAALNCITAVPDAILVGTPKSTRYMSNSPGQPIALITLVGWPFTVTSTGELINCSGFVGYGGNGWPGSTPGRVGPSPVAMVIRTSPAFAGLVAVTGEKSA